MLNSFFNLFSSFSSSSPDNTHDDTYPVHFYGQTGIIRDTISNYALRYNAVLDADKLRDSLVSLINTGEWRALGGRLRCNVHILAPALCISNLQTNTFQKNKELEIKVPREFTPARPAIRFSRVSFDSKIDLHPTTCRLPRTTGDIPSVHEGYTAFRGMTIPEDCRQDMQYYLGTDEPMIRLHVVSFADATLVSLIFPHALTDIMGFSGLLRAWSDVLAGQQAQDLLGMREDALDGVGMVSEKVQAPHVLEHIQIKGLSLVLFATRLFWDFITKRNVSSRTIYLPATFISRLRQNVKEEGAPDHVPFLSDSDLITAWGSRALLASKGSGPAMIYNILDMRGRLSALSSTAGTYVQNLVVPMVVYLPELGPSLPTIGYLAQRNRQSITEQATDTQLQRLMRLSRKSYASTGFVSVFGKWDAKGAKFSNWSRARLGEAADFSPAVVPTSVNAHSHEKICLPASYWGTSTLEDKLRDRFAVYGKDQEGNYWLQGVLRDETWKYIQREFDAYQ